MNQPHTLTVKILDKEYQVACPEEQEADLIVSAKYLDKQMRDIRDTGNLGCRVADSHKQGIIAPCACPQ